MSTKTTFKRIALVAVAALGLGVLSVAPSSATVSGVTGTVTNGTASTGSNYDSSTAGTITIAALHDAAGDSTTVTYALKSYPTTSGANLGHLRLIETTTGYATIVDTGTASNSTSTLLDSVTAGNTTANTFRLRTANAGYVGATFRMELDSASANIKAGTYVYTVVVKTFTSGSATVDKTSTYDVSVVVSTSAGDSKVASAANSTAVMNAGTSGYNGTVDSVVAAVATASTTEVATIRIKLINAAGVASVATESVTATITGPGTIGQGTVFGKSVVLAHTAGDFDLDVRPDGTAGVATINISTPSVTFAPKTVTFYAKSPKTITAANYATVLNVGTNSSTGAAVVATAVDANGTNWAGALYIKAVAAADALVGGSATAPVLCAYDPTEKAHFCPITTLTAGTAKFVVVDQSAALGTETAYAAAMSAATSNEVTVTVSAGVPTSVKLAFDKATYAPFEKATITVTPLDASGKALGTRAITSLFAAGGITSNVAFGAQSDTLTAVTLTTAAANGASTTGGAYTYTVYMPAQGDVTISATGGTGLAASGQVKVTATASVVNTSVDAATDAANEATDAANAATDAALAAADAADAATAAAQDASDAVAALSASVSKLISSLRAQITSLTNLVIKIQKKVRA